jgi:hypothetical protein
MKNELTLKSCNKNSSEILIARGARATMCAVTARQPAARQDVLLLSPALRSGMIQARDAWVQDCCSTPNIAAVEKVNNTCNLPASPRGYV